MSEPFCALRKMRAREADFSDRQGGQILPPQAVPPSFRQGGLISAVGATGLPKNPYLRQCRRRINFKCAQYQFLTFTI